MVEMLRLSRVEGVAREVHLDILVRHTALHHGDLLEGPLDLSEDVLEIWETIGHACGWDLAAAGTLVEERGLLELAAP